MDFQLTPEEEAFRTEVRAFLEQEISKLVLASPSSPDDAPAVERAGWTLPAQPSPSTSAPAAAPAAAPAKKGAAAAAAKEAAAADDSEGGDSEDGAASDPDEVLVQQERLEERMRRLRASRGPRGRGAPGICGRMSGGARASSLRRHGSRSLGGRGGGLRADRLGASARRRGCRQGKGRPAPRSRPRMRPPRYARRRVWPGQPACGLGTGRDMRRAGRRGAGCRREWRGMWGRVPLTSLRARAAFAGVE